MIFFRGAKHFPGGPRAPLTAGSGHVTVLPREKVETEFCQKIINETLKNILRLIEQNLTRAHKKKKRISQKPLQKNSVRSLILCHC